MRIQLADRLAQTRRRHFHRDARVGDRVGNRAVVEVGGAIAEDLDEIRVRQRVEQPASCGTPERLEVAPPRLFDTELVGAGAAHRRRRARR